MERLTVGQVEEAIDLPFESWEGECHGISLMIVKAGLVPNGRVARGWCQGVPFSQHSWIVVGDSYHPDVEIIDPTLWGYDDSVEGIWFGTARDGRHIPHGAGSIWKWGRPETAEETGEEPVALTPAEPLGKAARNFLDLAGPLGMTGWRTLAHAPVGGWPAGEIFAAMIDTPVIGGFIPIDVASMATGRNINDLYY